MPSSPLWSGLGVFSNRHRNFSKTSLFNWGRHQRKPSRSAHLLWLGGLSFSGTQERKARRALGRCKPDGIDRRQCVADAMPIVSLVFRDPQTAGCRSESKALPARVDSKCMTQNKVIGMLLR